MFDTRYEVYLADTAESRALHHQVRYQVFCIERGFEDPEAFAQGQEHDRWDDSSHHFVVQDKESGAGVAAARIILPTAGQLPVDRLGCITENPLINASRQQVAEVSRICIVRDEFASDPRRSIQPVSRAGESEVMLGLIRAIIRHSWDHDLPYFFMLVTRAFARLLKRLGVAWMQVGEGIEHRGLRAPYLIDVDASWRGLVARSGEVADMFSRHHLAYLSHAQTSFLRGPSEVAIARSSQQKAAA